MKIQLHKQYKYVMLLLLAVFMGACDKDELLDTGDKTFLSPDEIAQNAEGLLIGAYDVFQWQNLGVNQGNARHIYPVMWQGIRADDMVSQWATFWQPGLLLDDLPLVQPNNTNIAALWEKWFTGVQRANAAISVLEASEVDNKDQLIAEAQFIRAFCYFELVRHWGGVPLYTENFDASTDFSSVGRASVAEVYAQIEADLEAAIPNLQGRAATPTGRATRGAAQAILAKVHLSQGEYAEVLTYTSALISSGEYALEPNFADNFTTANEFGIESVLEIDYKSGINNGFFESVGTAAEGSSSYQMFGYIFNGNGAFGNSVPRPELIALYEDTDTRKDATFITPESILENGPQSCGCLVFNPDGTVVFGDAGNESQWIGTDIYNFFWLVNESSWVSRASMRKYNIGQITTLPQLSQSDLNEKLMRYAEVLLMHAEASLFSGTTSTGGAPAISGQDAFDQVRDRAYGGSAPAVALSLDNLKLERRKELATEGWNRFTDLVRWGDAASALAFKNFQVGRDELLPIPQSEIDVVGTAGLPQNPGY